MVKSFEEKYFNFFYEEPGRNSCREHKEKEACERPAENHDHHSVAAEETKSSLDRN